MSPPNRGWSASSSLSKVCVTTPEMKRNMTTKALCLSRKLISSLSPSVGGYKYKMSPKSINSCIFWLIIELFVGLAPSWRTITCQPTEILDSIAFHIDSKSALLSFAISCRRMYGIVFRRHFNYRIIRCKVSSISVWTHLIVHRSLVRNVRRLEIFDERSIEASSVPSGYQPPTPISNLPTMNLSCMRNKSDISSQHWSGCRYPNPSLGLVTILQYPLIMSGPRSSSVMLSRRLRLMTISCSIHALQ